MTDTHICVAGDKDVVVKVSGTMDVSDSKQLADILKQSAESADTLEVDLRSAVFIHTSVIQHLVSAGLILKKRDKVLKVTVAEGSHPARVLRIIGLDMIMTVVVVDPQAKR